MATGLPLLGSPLPYNAQKDFATQYLMQIMEGGIGTGPAALTHVALMLALRDLAEAAGHSRLAQLVSSHFHGPVPEEAIRARELVGLGSPVLAGPLRSVFSLVTFTDTSPGTHPFLLPGPITQLDYLRSEINSAEWQAALGRTLDGLAQDLQTVGSEVDHLLTVLEAWTRRVPYPSQDDTLPFYDVARMTAATAVCLSEAGHREDPFLLVAGDLTGVQRFLYTINPRGALRMLRARSLYLELVAEEAIAEFLSGLSRAHVIYSGGGRFYLLLPHTEEVAARMEGAARALNDWLLAVHGGRLALVVGQVRFGPNEFARATEIWARAGQMLAAEKSRKFAFAARTSGYWAACQPARGVCDVCHEDSSDLRPLVAPEVEGEEVPLACPTCRELNAFGRLLPDHQYLVRMPVGATPRGVQVGEHRYVPVKDPTEGGRHHGSRAVYSLGTWEPGAVPFPYCGYEAEDGQLVRMAEQALGDPLIAALRMDVDDLGRIFTHGLPEQHRDFVHLAALSRELGLFFKHHLTAICGGQPGGGLEPLSVAGSPSGERKVTVVYAGGDDLFIVGTWNDVAELAFDIRRAFGRYTAGNPALHLSAGLSLAHVGVPLYALAQMAGEGEEAAKQAMPPADGRTLWPQPKNRVAFFYSGDDAAVVSWPDAERVLTELLEPLLQRLGRREARRVRLEMSKALLHRLAAIVSAWRRDGRLAHPRLAYVLAKADEELRRKGADVASAWAEAKQTLWSASLMRDMGFALTWAELASRGGNAQ